MTFWSPINGAHTSGSSYPRSELRQLLDFNYSGTHVLSVTMAVRVVPTNGKITIGQAHFDGVSRACSIFCELEWQSGSVVSHVRDQVQQCASHACSSNSSLMHALFRIATTSTWPSLVHLRSESFFHIRFKWSTILSLFRRTRAPLHHSACHLAAVLVCFFPHTHTHSYFCILQYILVARSRADIFQGRGLCPTGTS